MVFLCSIVANHPTQVVSGVSLAPRCAALEQFSEELEGREQCGFLFFFFFPNVPRSQILLGFY